jgi:hypothetical protein
MEEAIKEIEEVLKKHGFRQEVKFSLQNVLGNTVLQYGIVLTPIVKEKQE